MSQALRTTYVLTPLLVAGCALILVPVGVGAQEFEWLYQFLALVRVATGFLVPILLSIGVIVFVWGAVVFIANADDERARIEGRTKMIWGVLALFVIVSVWGIVALIQDIGGINDAIGTEAPFSNFN